MKKMYSFTSILALFALMLLGQGCDKDNALDYPTLDDNTLALRINVHDIAESRSSLRTEGKTEDGQDPYNENKIEDFTVLFYKGGGQFLWSQKSTSLGKDKGGNYIIPVPKNQIARMDGHTTYNVYVVANYTFTSSEPQTEEALKKVVVNEDINKTTPTKFVMVGMTAKVIDMSKAEGKNLGTVDLKRVPAKVRLTLVEVKVDGYTQEGEAQAKLSNALDKGQLFNPAKETTAQLFASEYRKLTEKIIGSDKTAHFYSYYTKWEGEKERPTLTLMIKFKKDGEQSAKAYYYKVPVEAKESELKSNYLYDVKVKIEILGGLTEEEPKKVMGKLIVKDWTTKDDAFVLPATKYLLVAEKNVSMNNVSTYDIPYQSSSEIHFENIKAYAEYVDENGISKKVDYEKYSVWSQASEFPKISIKDGKIHIESKIPDNYIPKTIEFDVKNKDGFTEHVKVIQYPSLYITNTFGTASSLRPHGNFWNERHLKNKAIYRIVVQVPQDKLLGVDVILGFPQTQSQTFYKETFGRWRRKQYNTPVLTGNITKNDEETSKMVSPSFELASQLGATTIMPYFESRNNYPQAIYYIRGSERLEYNDGSDRRPYGAAFNCEKYTETRNGKILDDWRLPTEAEIKLVDRLQHAGKGVVKSIMTGNYYWDANNHNGATMMSKPDNSVGWRGNVERAYVRCVRDVKDNTVTK
ncbi:fimbrial tip adhesin FimD [Porphyromonas levii]|uniref:Major fimbrial subunit protein N-terminal domain-containing protein n=1 Tax=Porphyromonas levii TaxID=28114 RepID=A0A4Y8WRF8_9PORP|nr:fimbrial protein [Porphyromonas levii]TFH97097.1 hypothetical protein E4P47_00960 [Porphyromonas levii]TFH97710.1 hypothetical protein E4P48_00310 [Porphyromonas levii]